jgi:DNA-directed RNA polymerase subunit RPC12/RpoP
MGRHRSGICPKCRHRVLVRDRVLVEHEREVPGFAGTRRRCEGSGGKPGRVVWWPER